MKQSEGPREESLGLSAEQRIDAVCRRFEAAWKAGERPRLEDHLGQGEGREQQVLLRELLRLEVEYRRRRDETPTPQEYRDRFPGATELIDSLLGTDSTTDRSGAERTGPHTAVADQSTALPVVPGYEVLAELGHGGMGVVYKARQVKADRVVALKMILAGPHTSLETRLRFQIEAEAVARLSHRNVVQLFDVGEHDGLPFFSLEFCPGGSLKTKLAGLPQPPRQAAVLVEKLARAVATAHAVGLVHRDLKPDNVLLGEDGEPKVTDFGLARRLDDESEHTGMGQVMGTPAYMAPEQAEGRAREAGPAADVYSLGVLLYEALTGRVPFRGATVRETLEMVCSQPPTAPRQLQPRVPRDLETICLKCLRKEPENRYPGAAALADDLGRFLAGEPIWARPVSARERLVKWARRRPAVAGLLAALVFLTAAALGVIGGLYGEAIGETARAQQAERQAQQDRAEAEEKGREARAQKKLAESELDRAERELDRAERLVHAGHIEAAQREWEAGNTALAWEHLEACRWDFRGLEHRLLFALFTHNQITLRKPLECRGAWAISPDISRMAGITEAGKVKVWDAVSGKVLLELPAAPLRWKSTAGVATLRFSDDGSRIVRGVKVTTRMYVRGVQVWDARSGRALDPLPWDEASIVTFSVDGSRVATGNASTVQVWDARSGKVVHTLTGHSAAVGYIAFSRDGSRLVTALALPGVREPRYPTVRVWDTGTGKELCILRPSSAVGCVAVNSDGSRIATAHWEKADRSLSKAGRSLRKGDRLLSLDPSIRLVTVWDALKAEVLLVLKGHKGRVRSVAYSPDGSRLVTGSDDGTVKVWDAQNGNELLTLKGHTAGVKEVAFSSDGAAIISKDATTVKVWDLRSDQVPLVIQRPRRSDRDDPMRLLAISADGSRLAVAGYEDEAPGTLRRVGTLRVWDTRNGKRLFAIRSPGYLINSVALSPDGSRIALGGEERVTPETAPPVKLHVWDVHTGKERFLLDRPSGLHSLAVCRDGSRIVGLGMGNTLTVWDSVTGKVLQTWRGDWKMPPGDWTGARSSLNEDGSRLVTCSQTGPVSVRDVLSGKLLFTLIGHQGTVHSFAFSGDGSRIVTGGQDRTARLWDGVSGKPLLAFAGHKGPVRHVAFSSDGSRVASASGTTVKVWEAGSGKELFTLRASHPFTDKRVPSVVTSLAYSPDGVNIAAGGSNRMVQVWDAGTGLPRFTTPLLFDAPAVAFSSDGSRLVTLAQNWVRVWDAQSGKPLLSLRPKAIPSVGFRGGKVSVGFRSGKVAVGGKVAVPDPQPFLYPHWVGTLKVIAGHSGKEPFTIRSRDMTGGTRAISFSSDGSLLVGHAPNSSVKVWDAHSGKELLTLSGKRNESVSSVALSGDSSRLVTCRHDLLEVWEVRTGKQLLKKNLGLGAEPRLEVNHDGSRIMTRAGWLEKVWDGHTGKVLQTARLQAITGGQSRSFTGDGSRAVSADSSGNIQVWDTRSGKQLLLLQGPTPPFRLSASPLVSADGSCIIAGYRATGGDGRILVWNADVGQDLLTLRPPQGTISRVAVSDDGKRVIGQAVVPERPLGSGDGEVNLYAWDAVSGQMLPDPPERMPAGAGLQASAGQLGAQIVDGVIQVWRPEMEAFRKRREARDREQLTRLTRFKRRTRSATEIEKKVVKKEEPKKKEPSPREKSADVLRFVRLTAICYNGRRWDAYIYDLKRDVEQKVNTRTLTELTIKDKYGNDMLDAEVVRLGEEEMIFKAGGKYYRIRCGELFQGALEAPLTARQLKALNITPEEPKEEKKGSKYGKKKR
jgi:WD40 repeat protein/tRNA A-37 threonylcarbamoyl transferase component Bud32